ncbi:MAG: YcgL domain-containing protein [Halioglobus sp.]|nr:YcgL domain-containing protein [Halioglobus sp.]
MSVLCQVFKSSRQAEMYLYLEKSRGAEEVPDALLARFGELIPVMMLQLTPERRLARADVREVIASIQRQGFYLQMPPTTADLLARERGDG